MVFFFKASINFFSEMNMPVFILLFLFLFVESIPTGAYSYNTKSLNYGRAARRPHARLSKLDALSPEPAIADGTRAKKNEWPWMAGLVKKATLRPRIREHIICGGSIISLQYVLTAAHCTVPETPFSIFVLVGDLTLSDGYKYPIQKIIFHRYYNAITLRNDISLLQLKGVITARDVMPVRIHTIPYFNYEGHIAYVTGWGRTSRGSAASKHLMKVAIRIVPLAVCSFYRHATENNICAGTDTRNICRGDSGGPMVVRDNVKNSWLLIGITSFRKRPCGSRYPAGYIKVGNYANWIRNAIDVSLHDPLPRKFPL